MLLTTVHPGPLALRAALVVLVGALAALTAGAVRLESGRRERDTYQRVFMSHSCSASNTCSASPMS